jgi:hypothetical protein
VLEQHPERRPPKPKASLGSDVMVKAASTKTEWNKRFMKHSKNRGTEKVHVRWVSGRKQLFGSLGKLQRIYRLTMGITSGIWFKMEKIVKMNGVFPIVPVVPIAMVRFKGSSVLDVLGLQIATLRE